jgi:DnaK suppressor protein
MKRDAGLQCEESMRTKKKEKLQKFQPFENLLRARLAELTAHLDQLRQEIVIDDEVDDEVTQAYRSNNREFVMTTMEREVRNVAEIEQALERIAKGEYGVCVTCETPIPDKRLHAIPWTRLCVDCAGGGINRRAPAHFGSPLMDSR